MLVLVGMKTLLTPLFALVTTGVLAQCCPYEELNYVNSYFQVAPVWERVLNTATTHLSKENNEPLKAFFSDNTMQTLNANSNWTAIETADETIKKTVRFENEILEIEQELTLNDTTRLYVTADLTLISYSNGVNWIEVEGVFNPIKQVCKTSRSAIYGVSEGDQAIYKLDRESGRWLEHMSLSYEPTCIEAFNNSGVAVGCSGAIYISMNDGRSWMGYGYGSDYGVFTDFELSGNSLYVASNTGVYRCELPSGSGSESGEEIDVALAAGLNNDAVKLFRTSEESGLDLTCSQSSAPRGEDFVDFEIEIPRDDVCSITVMSAAGTEIPLITEANLTAGTYNLKVYNSDYKGVFYVMVTANGTQTIIAALV